MSWFKGLNVATEVILFGYVIFAKSSMKDAFLHSKVDMVSWSTKNVLGRYWVVGLVNWSLPWDDLARSISLIWRIKAWQPGSLNHQYSSVPPCPQLPQLCLSPKSFGSTPEESRSSEGEDACEKGSLLTEEGSKAYLGVSLLFYFPSATLFNTSHINFLTKKISNHREIKE